MKGKLIATGNTSNLTAAEARSAGKSVIAARCEREYTLVKINVGGIAVMPNGRPFEWAEQSCTSFSALPWEPSSVWAYALNSCSMVAGWPFPLPP
jgi:hypothetical protein